MNACHDIHGLRAAGATIREIAQITGLSPSAVHKRLAPGPRAAVPPPPTPKPRRRNGQQERKCMTCGAAFLSEGPHNRMCATCRKKSASPFDIPATIRHH